MGQKIKQVKGKVLAKHETEAVWDESNYGAGVAYVPELGEKVIYDPDDQHPYPRVKYGDGVNIVKYLRFSIDPYAVAFGYEQNLSDTEKARARANLGMEYINEELQNLQEAFTEQVGQLRTDLDNQVEDLQNNKFDKAGGTIEGDLRVAGNLVVSGESTETHLEHVTTPQNTITLRDDQAEGLLEEEYTGLIAKKYDGTNDGMLVFDKEGTAYVGDVGDVQPLATRAPETQMRDGSLVEWNSATKRLQSTDKPVVFDSAEVNEELVAYTRDVPVNSANYAKLTKLGGMTRKCGNLFDKSKTTKTETDTGFSFTWTGTYGAPTTLGLLKNIAPQLKVGDRVALYGTSVNSPVGGGVAVFYLVGMSREWRNGEFITITNETLEGGVNVYGNSGQLCEYKDIIITQVENAPYEPYFEGLRSAPVTEVESVGANILPYPYVSKTQTINGITFTDNGDGTITANGTATGQAYFVLFQGVFPIGKYFLSGAPKDGLITTSIYFSNGNYSLYKVDNGSGVAIDVTTEEIISVVINISKDTVVNNAVFKPMLVKGTTALPSTPYTKNTLAIPETVRPKHGIPNGAYDFIDFEKKQFVQRVGVAVFDGSTDEQWMDTSVSNTADYNAFYTRQYATNGHKLYDGKALCDKLSLLTYGELTGANVGGFFMGDATDKQIIIRVPNSITTTTELRVWLAENPLTVYYELAEPIITDISDILPSDNIIAVEGGGTLTFVNEFGYDVPSEVAFYEGSNDIIGADTFVGDLAGTAARAVSDKNGNDITETYAKKTDIPTKVSELDNDAEYITADALSDLGGGDMLKSVYDTNGDGIVDKARADKSGNPIDTTYAKLISSTPQTIQCTGGDTVQLFKGNKEGEAYIGFKDSSNKSLGWLGMKENMPMFYSTNNISYKLITEANISSCTVAKASAADLASKVVITDSTAFYQYPIIFESQGHCYKSANNTVTMNPATGTLKATTFDGNATSATSATKATQDASGNVITTTYATKTELAGKAPSGYGFGEDTNVMVSDIDNITKTGFYQFVTSVFDNAATNYYLIHQIHNTNYACQTAIKVTNSNVVYQRIKEGGVWGSWTHYITAGNIGSQSVNYAATANKANAADNVSWTSSPAQGSITPIGAALSEEHAGNKTAFINGNAIKIEYSTDGGSTYTDSGIDATTKSWLFTSSGSVPVGGNTAMTSSNYTKLKTRITLTAQDGTNQYLYTDPKKLLVNVSSAVTLSMLVEYRKGNSSTWNTFGTYTVAGWSGWNDIPLILSALGGATSQTSHVWYVRFTFSLTSYSNDYSTTKHIGGFRLFGTNSWYVPSTLGSTGHLYSYDYAQNATFPGSIYSPKAVYGNPFYGDLKGNADTATKATQDASGNVITDTYVTKTELEALRVELEALKARVSELEGGSGGTTNEIAVGTDVTGKTVIVTFPKGTIDSNSVYEGQVLGFSTGAGLWGDGVACYESADGRYYDELEPYIYYGGGTVTIYNTEYVRLDYVEDRGYTVDLTNTDTRERWSNPDNYAPNIHGDFYFKINGVEYDGQNTANLVKYSNVTSFKMKTEGGMTCEGFTYSINGETQYFSFEYSDHWYEIPVSGNIVVDSISYRACLVADTMITMADGTEKRIDTLEKGDMLLSVDPATNELIATKLLYSNVNAYHPTATKYDIWTFEDGSIVKTAKAHRLYNVDHQAMVYMDEWQIGERAYNKNGEYVALISHKVVEEEVQHFTLFCEHNNYFANGVLAGNRHTPEIHL